jgi:hypothetical protein
MGTQQVQIPSRTQGRLTLSLGDQSSDYRIPFGIGSGNPR